MNILIASSIYPKAIEKLRDQHDVICAFNADEETLESLIKDREVLIFRSGVQITAEVMEQGPDLRLILRAGSGVDNIDLDYVERHGLRLVRIPGPGAKAVAELSFAMMLVLARNVLKADNLLREGCWAKREMTGYLLTGKVLGIIGMGNIGTRVAELGVAWGMEVIGCVEHPSPERAARFQEQNICLTDCAEVLANADFVSIHVPLKDSTQYMIDGQALRSMKRGAFLFNLARGGVVDESALYQALTEDHLAGAGLDVHEAEGNGNISPFADLSNVVLTPHIGAGTFDSQREIGDIVVNLINTYLAEQSADPPVEQVTRVG